MSPAESTTRQSRAAGCPECGRDVMSVAPVEGTSPVDRWGDMTAVAFERPMVEFTCYKGHTWRKMIPETGEAI